MGDNKLKLNDMKNTKKESGIELTDKLNQLCYEYIPIEELERYHNLLMAIERKILDYENN